MKLKAVVIDSRFGIHGDRILHLTHVAMISPEGSKLFRRYEVSAT